MLTLGGTGNPPVLFGDPPKCRPIRPVLPILRTLSASVGSRAGVSLWPHLSVFAFSFQLCLHRSILPAPSDKLRPTRKDPTANFLERFSPEPSALRNAADTGADGIRTVATWERLPQNKRAGFQTLPPESVTLLACGCSKIHWSAARWTYCSPPPTAQKRCVDAPSHEIVAV